MATPIVMPKQGNTVESVIIVEWKKQVGETVAVDDVLCEVETDKANDGGAQPRRPARCWRRSLPPATKSR
jgi:hypothetical protein